MGNGIDVIFTGFPGKAEQTYLGWSTVALVHTNEGPLLVDTGGHGARPFLIRALAERGLRCEDIGHVFLTHLHFDHCANLSLFPKARFYLSRAEWEHAWTGKDPCTLEGVLPPLKGEYTKRLVESDGEEILPGLRAHLTPGHTPGCLSLVGRKDHQRWAICGDSVKNRIELIRGEVAMTQSPKESAASIKKLKKIADKFLPGHDCWLQIEKGEIVPEGGNDVEITLPEGMSMGGRRTITLSLD